MKAMRPETPSIFIPGMIVFGMVTWLLVGLLFSDTPADRVVSGAQTGFLLSLVFILERWIRQRIST